VSVYKRNHFTTNMLKNQTCNLLNGVRQGGVASPVMFCVYIDELLSGLRDKGVGCWLGKFLQRDAL